jgi:dihydroorotate dehydrogenase
VGQLARRSSIPIIGAGGIHSVQDARDYLEAGAVAVQVDSAVWAAPKLLENISRELGGMSITQPMDTPDNWEGD